MKIFLILLAISLQVSAAALSQEITLSVKNEPFREVMQSIRKQSGYQFLFKSSYLKDANPVTLHIKKASIDDVLKKIFENQPFTYSLKIKTVIIQPKKENQKEDQLIPFAIDDEQQITINGKVTDQENKPLIGVNIRVKGTNDGTYTDEKGNFTISLEQGSILQFSFIGYQTIVKSIQGNTDFKITLIRKNSELDQVQIIGYGTTTRRLTTSNIASVKADAIQKQPVTNPLLALQGRVPGLIITQSTGVAGGTIQVQIQGRNSLNYGNDPFYVIDGMPFNGRMLQGAAPASILKGSGSPFSFLNPADIESIEILKDADATSIYGSRAANGAILITTKKGKEGETQVSLNMQQGWGKVPRKIDMMGTKEFLEMRREALRNDNLQVETTDYDINGTWDTTRYTDWQKELIGNTAHFSNFQASISGGSAKTQFLLGMGYIRESSVFIGNFADRKGNLNLNLQHASTNGKFKVQFSANYLKGNNELPTTDLTSSAVSLAPNAPALFNTDGSLNWELNPDGITTFYNPASNLLQTYQYRAANLIANTEIGYEIIDGLRISSSFGYNNITSKEKTKSPLAVNDPNTVNKQRFAYFDDKSNTGFSVEPKLQYNRKFGFGAFNFLVGSTYQENRSEGTGFSASGFNTDLEMNNIRAAPTVTVSNSIDARYRYAAIFARLNYILNDRYILNLTARRDGSSRFGVENQFHDFYSVAGAWIFSEEAWLKNNTAILNFGKLKLSYGTTGNDQIGDYTYLNLFSPFTSGVTTPYQGAIGLQATAHGNPYLQWELTKKFNAGIDLGFISNRLLLDVNYYVNASSNQLLNDPLPVQTGFQTVKQNRPATVRNSGWEMSLNINPINAGKFSWKSNFNLTLPKNRLVAFPGIEKTTFANTFVLNQPVSIRKVFVYSGVNKQAGTYEFINNKGENVSTVNSLTDNTGLVNIDPKFYGGWQNILSYKGFELDFLFQFNKQIGNNSFIRFGNLLPGYFGYNQPLSMGDRWRSQGNNVTVQKANSNFVLYSGLNIATNSDAAYTDVSFINLKNVSLSYVLPQVLLKRIAIQTLSVFAQGQNLFIWTKYKGLNPESSGFESSVPPLRVITLGLRVNL